MIYTIAGPISASFQSSGNFSWLATAYVIGSSVSQSLSSHLTDMFGRRKGLAVCYVLFAAGTLSCGLAPILPVFLFGRALQGVGGGAICAIIALVETDLIAMKSRALVEGLGNIFYGTVLAFGGVYGSLVYSTIGWRWAFLIQVPIIAANALIIVLVINAETRTGVLSALRQVDYIGICTLLATLILFQLGLNSGSVSLIWNSPLVISSLSIGTVAAAIFVYWESTHAANPIVPFRLLNRGVTWVQLSSVFSTGSYASTLFYIPLYLTISGIPSRGVGLRYIPMAIAFAISSFTAGYVVKKTQRYYHLNIGLQMLSVLSYALLSILEIHTPAYVPFICLGLLGVAAGGIYVTTLMGILTSVPDRQQTVILGVSCAVRSLSITIGLTIASLIFQSLFSKDCAALFATRGAGQGQIQCHGLLVHFGAYEGVDDKLKDMIVGSYLKAIRGVFLFSTSQAAAGVLCSFLISNNQVV